LKRPAAIGMRAGCAMPLKHVPDARGCSMVILSSPRTLHPNAGTPTVRAGCEWPLTRPPMIYSGQSGLP
ncbi:hypothetical protein CLOP_g17285, partial [Closterium sp. NIES-67]